MTNHVEHTNKLIGDLKAQYEARIAELRAKIDEQHNEIDRLNRQIGILLYKQSENA